MYLPFKTVWHKLYGDLQLLPVLTYYWKNLLMDFITGLSLSADWKGNNYDSIFIIIDCLTKMV